MDLQPRMIEQARQAQARAYAPYSGYRVGAAILDADGNIWAGCNVENVSYGLSVCAERSAISRMVGEGHTRLMAVAVVTEDGGMPCGMCLQTLLEFAVDPETVQIWTVSDSGEVKTHSLHSLIPFGFVKCDLRRTE
jgi:cytidine deaminase